MSSNIKIQRICQHCGNEFTAKTTVTKYCGDYCAKRAYKTRKRAAKVEESNQQTKSIKNKPILDLKSKEYLSIKDTAFLLNSSRQTVYNMIRAGTIPAVNLSERKTLIRKSDINRLFEVKSLHLEPVQRTININECFTISQALAHYSISEKALYELIKRNNIPKLKKGRYTYVPITDLDNILQ